MAPTETLRLQARGITKRYGAVCALDDANFDLRRGEVMALLGENGAGKSTIVGILSGLVHADTGTIDIDGEPVALGSTAASQMAGIAVVQQELSTVPTLTVGENLLIGQHGARLWWSRRFLEANTRALLSRVGLDHLEARTPVTDLSVAERQLLEIARVLAREARIVIMDEPTAALSDAEIPRVLGVVRRLAQEGCAVIYVTHRLAEVFEIADRVTIFRNGHSHPAVDVAGLDVDQIISMMLGRDLGDMYPPHSPAPPGQAVLDVRGLLAAGLARPVDLTVQRGHILGLTGQLGSGASVVVQALAGMTPLLAGSVSLNAQPLHSLRRRRGIRSGIAYCSADRKRDGIFPAITIQRNLSSPWLERVSTGLLVSPRREKARARDTAQRFAIHLARMRSPVSTLSGGNQQKVAVGKWLGIEPQLLLVDEPTRGVDVGARAEIYRQLRALCDQGLAIVVCSSDNSEILGLCDVIATFNRGVMSAPRPRQEWTAESLARQVMHSVEVTS